MIKQNILTCFFAALVLASCNSNMSKEEKQEMWSKAQTRGEIVNRSGTPFNMDTHRDLALADAENRLVSGGGLFGKKSLMSFGKDKEDENRPAPLVSSIGMQVNQFLWRASIETISFMPLSSADPIAGTIITEWYTYEDSVNERCKLNIFINGKDLKTDNLKVRSFCQLYKNNQWINIQSDQNTNTKLENAILNKAKKIRLSTG